MLYTHKDVVRKNIITNQKKESEYAKKENFC